MNSKQEPDPKDHAEPTVSSSQGSGSTPAEAECERLRKEVQRLEEERQRDRERLEALEQECQAFRSAFHAWALQQVTPEELQRWCNEEDTEGSQELHEFIEELENIVRDNEHA
jgi:predicted RNase H-like nuclease (RuvC/YqgF family)